MNRIAMLITVVVFFGSAIAVLWMRGMMDQLRVQQARAGVAYIEVEADMRDTRAPWTMGRCSNPSSVPITRIDACSTAAATDEGEVLATISGPIRLSVASGSAALRMETSGAQQQVICPPAGATVQPTWRLCLAHRKGS